MAKKLYMKYKMYIPQTSKKAALGKKSGKSCGCGCTGRRKVK
jgi:hypothetical protein